MSHLSVDLRLRLWNAAEQEAVRVFATNLHDLLLAAPAGARRTMGLDPGFRTGVKVAVVDATGNVAATATIYPHEPQRLWDEALAVLAKLARDHGEELIAIGNGTASRETDKLATELVRLLPELKLSKVVVSEAGASVYSASAFASQDMPDLDVTLRGAVSIARRLQDPLDIPIEAQTALRAFLAAAVVRSSITASVDATGTLTLHSPEAAAVLGTLFGPGPRTASSR